MRTTVGPLPPAVYWRRRLVVLGAVLLGVIILAFACSGGDDPAKPNGSGVVFSVGPPAAPTAAASGARSADPSAPTGGKPGVPAATDVAAGPAGAAPNTPAVAEGMCSDAEVTLIPVPGVTATQSGQSIDLHLRIKNVSNRTCARDVGADAQEIYVKQGARKIWSSDVCGLQRGSDVKELQPGQERSYLATWNGHESSQCHAGTAVGPIAPAGEYEIVGRLGVKMSHPVKLTITSAGGGS